MGKNDILFRDINISFSDFLGGDDMFLFDSFAKPEVSLAGIVEVDSPNKHFERTPMEYILYIVLDGRMQLVEGEESYTLEKQDIIILDPTRTHYGIESVSDVKYLYIHFTSNGIREVQYSEKVIEAIMIENKLGGDEKLLVPKQIRLNDFDGNKVVGLANRIILEYQEKELYYKGYINQLLQEILVVIGRAFANRDMGKMGRKSDIVFSVLEYLKCNFKNRFTGYEIEASLHMNFDYLNRIFKKETGYTIMHYTNLYRINEAKNMLRSGVYNVYQTAAELGFANEFYFSRVFKKYEGISPSEFLIQNT